MELTGRPPVPPRKAFGLWVSEFGYDSWDEIDALRDGLRAAGFPVDGFVLDLNWFGGIELDRPDESEMGRLDWDRDQEPRLTDNPYSFPDPAGQVPAYAEDDIGLVAIEESYLANSTATFAEMPAELTAYRRTDGRCDPAQPGSAGRRRDGVLGRRADDRLDRPGGGRLDPCRAAATRTWPISGSPGTGPTSASPRASTAPPATTAWRRPRRGARTSTATSTTSTT